MHISQKLFLCYHIHSYILSFWPKAWSSYLFEIHWNNLIKLRLNPPQILYLIYFHGIAVFHVFSIDLHCGKKPTIYMYLTFLFLIFFCVSTSLTNVSDRCICDFVWKNFFCSLLNLNCWVVKIEQFLRWIHWEWRVESRHHWVVVTQRSTVKCCL